MEKSASTKKLYKCKNVGCRQTFGHPMERKRHYKKCEKAKPTAKYDKINGNFVCASCSRMFAKQANVSRHVKTPCKLPATSRTHVCDRCTKSFQFKCRLDKHNCQQTSTNAMKRKKPAKKTDDDQDSEAPCSMLQVFPSASDVSIFI